MTCGTRPPPRRALDERRGRDRARSTCWCRRRAGSRRRRASQLRVAVVDRRVERNRHRGVVRVGDQREAILRAELRDQLAHGGARLLDLVAAHRAGAVEDDHQIGRPADARGARRPARRAMASSMRASAVPAEQHGAAVERAGERHRAAGGRGEAVRAAGGRGTGTVRAAGPLPRASGAGQRGASSSAAGNEELGTSGLHASSPFRRRRCRSAVIESVEIRRAKGRFAR